MRKMVLLMMAVIAISGCTETCEDAKQKIDTAISALNHCESNDDCATVEFGCPFGCSSYINKDADQAEVKSAIEDYTAKCEMCDYDCVLPKPAVCTEGRCVESEAAVSAVDGSGQEVQVTAQVMECPVCDDQNSCTNDVCGADTDYKCTYEAIKPCCGDQICEKSEVGTCDDCPVCETSETCRVASFDYDKQECVVTRKSKCCGNDVCEIGESCTSCKDDCTCKEGSTLDKYPGFLTKSPYVVVGDEAKGTDVFTASNLATALLVSGIKIDTKLASQVGKVSEHDLVILGRPCENKLLADFLKVSSCDGFLEPGRAVVKLVVKDGNEYVLLAGYSADDTAKASELLKKKGLTGTEVMVDTSGSTAKVMS